MLLLALAGCGAPRPPETAWVGHLAPRDGQAERAIDLGLRPLAEGGELFDGKRLGVRHVEAATAEQARAEAARLLAVNRVAALLVGPGVPGAEEVVATARPHGAAVVLMQEVAGPVDGAVLVAAGPGLRGRTLAAFGRERLKLSRVALVADRGDRLSAARAEAFAARWREGGGQVREWAAEGPLGRALAERPEAVALAVPASKAGALALGGFAGPVFVLAGNEVGSEWATAYTATDYAAEAPLPPEGEAWRRAYAERFGQPPGRAAALARDGLTVLLAGLRGGGPGRAELREQLEGLGEVAAVTGRLSWDRGQPRRPVFVVRTAGGKREVVWTAP